MFVRREGLGEAHGVDRGLGETEAGTIEVTQTEQDSGDESGYGAPRDRLTCPGYNGDTTAIVEASREQSTALSAINGAINTVTKIRSKTLPRWQSRQRQATH